MRQFKAIGGNLTESGKPGLTVRKFDWEFEKLDPKQKYVVGGNQFQSYLLYGLSLVFPPGERFFINSLKAVKSKLPKEMESEVKAFIGQESQHGNAHKRFNEALEDLGWNVESLSDFLNKYVGMEEQNVAPAIKTWRVSVTAAYEHLTAVWAIHFLRSLESGPPADKRVEDLLAWHSLEEIEHKHVAFDAMESLGVKYPVRVLGMVAATTVLAAIMTAGTVYFIKQDNDFSLPNFLREAFEDITGETLFSLTHLMGKGVLSYLEPGFHPNNEDTLAEAHKLLGNRFKEAT